MIDAKENIIYFGYGDIGLGHVTNHLFIMPFKPPQEVGSMVNFNTVEQTGQTILLKFTSIREINRLQDTLSRINPTNTSFVFQGYTFDFTKYNEKSKMVLNVQLNGIKKYIRALIAC